MLLQLYVKNNNNQYFNLKVGIYKYIYTNTFGSCQYCNEDSKQK